MVRLLHYLDTFLFANFISDKNRTSSYLCIGFAQRRSKAICVLTGTSPRIWKT